MQNNKNFKIELEFIQQLNTIENQRIQVIENTDVNAYLTRKQGTFELNIDHSPEIRTVF